MNISTTMSIIYNRHTIEYEMMRVYEELLLSYKYE